MAPAINHQYSLAMVSLMTTALAMHHHYSMMHRRQRLIQNSVVAPAMHHQYSYGNVSSHGIYSGHASSLLKDASQTALDTELGGGPGHESPVLFGNGSPHDDGAGHASPLRNDASQTELDTQH
eukprot:12425690-Karenia_brevis.AAC.1